MLMSKNCHDYTCHVILKEMLFEWSNLDKIFMTKLEILIENSVESNIVWDIFQVSSQ